MAGLLEGVLPAIFSGADQVKRRVKGLLGDPREFLGQRSQDLQTMQDQDSALAYRRGLLSPQDPATARMARNDPAFNAQQAAEAEQRMLDIAMQGLTVWHGSPHKFDKFDMSKIGTGEGAQAYGHGLYFAENPGVAATYKDLFKDQIFDKNPEEIGKALFGELEKNSIVRGKAPVGSTREMLDEAEFLKRWKELRINWWEQPAAIRTAVEKKFDGNLYKVDLPDSAIEKMLDWDKPLSQQPEALAALRKAGLVRGNTAEGLEMFRGPTSKVTPEQLIDDLSTQWSEGYGMDGLLAIDAPNGRAAASQYLKSLGFPGIRYFDGGSRGAGQGTRNFVVFDDQLPKILERNGGLLGQ